MRLWLVLVLLAVCGVLVVRIALGHRHPVLLTVLLVPGLVLGWFEYEDRRADERMAAVASQLAGHPVHVECQRLTASMVDVSSDLGFVAYGPDGRPGDTAVLKYDACRALLDWLGSAKDHPSIDQVVAVHVLAHESEHLAGVTSESLAECRSLQATERTARLLGATPAQARDLAVRYATEVYPRLPEAYQSPDCRDGGPLDEHPDDARWP